MTTAANKGSVGRMLGKMAIGAAVGAASAMLFFNFFGAERLASGDPSVALGVAAGLIYALLGCFVGLGVVAPNAGARFLNVQDAEELREQRALLAESATGCTLVGIFLLVLCFAGEAMVTREVALVVSAVCLAGLAIVSVRTSRRSDELMRQISSESSALALYLTVAVIGGWAALAHLGFVEWMGPLAWIGLLALLQLVAIFWVSGKRGLLQETASSAA